MSSAGDFPKVERVKLSNTTDTIIQQVDQFQPSIPESLIKELLVSTGFQSQDVNAYRLVAHVCDKWLYEITESIISKKLGADRRKRDPEFKIQLTTEDIVNDLEQRGVKLQNPYQYPQIDPELLNFDK